MTTSQEIHHSWSLAQAQEIYDLPFPELVYQAQTLHRKHFPGNRVQRSTLLSIKTGGCPEDCAYCPQASRYDTGVDKHNVLPKDVVVAKAREAKKEGSTRFCMGAAWRHVKDGEEFDSVIDLVEAVHAEGLEVCCTLGMLNENQAKRLKDAGCYAYNHNLDTSPEYYGEIITTRTYEERLETLRNVRSAGITVCCGGIVGLGEGVEHRLGLLVELATQKPHPESVPINMLVKVEGTPLENEGEVDPIEFVRIIATARIMMPASYVRLSAGRTEMTDEMQALCFLAGANSMFAGEKLLTTPNPVDTEDRRLIKKLGMHYQEAANA